MAVWVRVGLKNETRAGLAEIRKDLAATAIAGKDAFQADAGAELRDALHGVADELARMTIAMKQQQQATQVIHDQAEAQRELHQVTQQVVTINEAEKTSLTDVALVGLQAYLMYTKLNAIKAIATSLWANHRTAVVAGTAALGGVAVATGGMVVGFMAVNAVLGLVGAGFDSLKKSGSKAADDIESSSNRAGEAWSSLVDKLTMNLGGEAIAAGQADVIEDIAAAIYTVRDALPNYTIGEALFGDEGSLSERATKEFGKLQTGLAELSQKTLYFGGSMTHSVLNSLGGLSDRIVGPEAAAMLKATRAVFTESTLQREHARVQGLENEEFFKKLANKQADAEIAAKARAHKTIVELDRALKENKYAIESAADGSEDSDKKLKALHKERQEMESKRQEILSEQIALTERLASIERKSHADFVKGEADELRSVRQVEQAQKAVLDLMKKLNAQGKLDKALLDEASQRYEAYGQRKQQLLKEEAETLKAVAKVNAELMKAKEDASTAAASKAAQDLRDLIKEARGVLNPEHSLTSELEGQFSDRDVTKEIIRKRQEEARAKHIEKNRARVDLEGDAWGNTETERKANQSKFDREIRKINHDIERDTKKQIAGARRGKAPQLEDEDVIAARQQLLNDRADKAVKGLRLSPQAKTALLEQQKIDREARQQQLGLQNKANQVKGLLGPQPGQPGFNPARQAGGTNPAEQAVAQGFGEFGNMARSQMQWGQQVTQTATAAQADAAQAKAMFEQLSRQMGANGRTLRATQGGLKQ